MAPEHKNIEKLPIVGYEDLYEIDDNGIVYSIERKVKKWDGFKTIKPKVMNAELSKGGYLRVGLSLKGIRKKYLVHRLVAIVFLKNVEEKPDVNHKDGNKSNNNKQNLEWCTKSENTIHAIKELDFKPHFVHQKKGHNWYKDAGKKNPARKPVVIMDKNGIEVKVFDSATDCGLFFKKHAAQISSYISGKRNNKIYNFKYKQQ